MDVEAAGERVRLARSKVAGRRRRGQRLFRIATALTRLKILLAKEFRMAAALTHPNSSLTNEVKMVMISFEIPVSRRTCWRTGRAKY